MSKPIRRLVAVLATLTLTIAGPALADRDDEGDDGHES
jgi:hypothetical protein